MKKESIVKTAVPADQNKYEEQQKAYDKALDEFKKSLEGSPAFKKFMNTPHPDIKKEADERMQQLEESQKAALVLNQEQYDKVFGAFWDGYAAVSLVSDQLDILAERHPIEEIGHCHNVLTLAIAQLDTIKTIAIFQEED